MASEHVEEQAEPNLIAKATSTATKTAAKVMAWFPVRVWQRFSQQNGQILASGVSYQALFSIFAAFYVAFAVVGVWLGADRDAIQTLIDLINRSLPGVIGDGEGALIKPAQLFEIAAGSSGVLSITGIVALLATFWTAVGWIGNIRTAVRNIFGLPPEAGNIIWITVRDLLAALGFALLLLLGSVIGIVGSAALGWVFELLNWPTHSFWFNAGGFLVTVIASFLVNTVTLVLLFRFLTGTDLSWRNVLPGSFVGAAGVTVLQVLFGTLIGNVPSNPLLVTFAVLIGLLAWIRFVMMVILVAGAWVAEQAADNDIPLIAEDDHDRAVREATTLVQAGELEFAAAQEALRRATFWQRPRRRRERDAARVQLTQRRDALAALSTADDPAQQDTTRRTQPAPR